jgi:hypothetical protein
LLVADIHQNAPWKGDYIGVSEAHDKRRQLAFHQSPRHTQREHVAADEESPSGRFTHVEGHLITRRAPRSAPALVVLDGTVSIEADLPEIAKVSRRR